MTLNTKVFLQPPKALTVETLAVLLEEASVGGGSMEELAAYLFPRLDARPTPPPCSVCIGQPLRGGRKCICGGLGTAWAEARGLRERLVDLEIALGFYPTIPPQSSKAYEDVRVALLELLDHL